MLKNTTLKLIVLSSVLGMGTTSLMASHDSYKFIYSDNYTLDDNYDEIKDKSEEDKDSVEKKESKKRENKYKNKYKNNFSDEELRYKTVKELNKDQRDYAKNESGLVTAVTAAKWINDWQANKPAGVEGRLFIMQIGLLPGNTPFIKHDDVNVFTFDRTAGCTTTGDTRNDGVSDIPMPIFSGGMTGMDGAFWAYDINPQKDMLLVVVASDEPKNMALATRFLWTMTYWGMKSDHVAIMDGTAMYMFDPVLNPSIKELAGVEDKLSMFTQYGSEYLMAPGGKLDFGNPAEGRNPAERKNFQSIKTLKTKPNFDLFASTADMMNAIDKRKTVIIDGRSADEYNANIKVERSKTESKICGINHDQQCYTAFEGHIKGAKNLEYTNIINREDYIEDLNGDGTINEKDSSMTFKSKKELRKMFKRLGVRKNTDVYTYCRTGTRSALITFASYEVLGLKTHMYDGSWIQWGKLGMNKDTYGNEMIPKDSPWRVDTKEYTTNIKYNKPIDVNPAAGLNPYSENGNLIVEEDSAYRAN